MARSAIPTVLVVTVVTIQHNAQGIQYMLMGVLEDTSRNNIHNDLTNSEVVHIFHQTSIQSSIMMSNNRAGKITSPTPRMLPCCLQDKIFLLHRRIIFNRNDHSHITRNMATRVSSFRIETIIHLVVHHQWSSKKIHQIVSHPLAPILRQTMLPGVDTTTVTTIGSRMNSKKRVCVSLQGIISTSTRNRSRHHPEVISLNLRLLQLLLVVV
mmetsp:Transcript_30441/g.46706  ORF Transcript_30441/g.46706 Transcript_30441/m.46706 type:complete len:211 (+) Transcript_30441:458-1090(+)